MFIEIHILQNFAPSCLNRDDTNTPKDCTFGDYRRARISSQCFKRAIRKSSAFERAVSTEAIADRTRRLPDSLRKQLVDAGREPETATAVIQHVFGALGFDMDSDSEVLRTKVALFLSRGEQQRLSDAILSHFEELSASAGGNGKGDKGKKSKDKPKLPSAVEQAFLSRKVPAEAADIALFGRMIAETKNRRRPIAAGERPRCPRAALLASVPRT